MFDWRTWLKQTLDGNPQVVELAAGGIYGQLEETPATKPFIVFRFSATQPQVVVAAFQDATIWFHDVGGYTRIDTLSQVVRELIVGPVAGDDAVHCDWLGDSPDLADDGRGTLVRNSVYRFVGRR
jgi:hypothetical protein